MAMFERNDVNSIGVRPFTVRCDAGPDGLFNASIRKLSLTVSQQISRNGSLESWDSVLVLADQQGASLVIRVLVCHPDWDEPLQIATIESLPTELKLQISQSDPHGIGTR